LARFQKGRGDQRNFERNLGKQKGKQRKRVEFGVYDWQGQVQS